MAKYCPECGIQLRDRARFCTSCGASVLEQASVSLETVEPEKGAVHPPDHISGSLGLAQEEPAPPSGEKLTPPLREEVATPQEEPLPKSPTVEPRPEGEVSVERFEVEIEPERARRPDIKDVIRSLRLMFDRQRFLWQASGTITAWMLFAILSFFAYVTSDQSPALAVLLRTIGWVALSALLFLTAAAIATTVTSEIGSHFRLEVQSSPALLKRLPAILGPPAIFLGFSVVGIGMLAALVAIAQFGEVGEIIWSLLVLPQFLIAFAAALLLVAALASLVYVPTLAVTNGASFSQTLFRFLLIFRRDFKRASGYFLLVIALSLLVGLAVWGVSLLLWRLVDLVAAEASAGRTTAIAALGSDLARHLLPGGLPSLIANGNAVPSLVLRLEAGIKVACFLWSISLVIISAIVTAFPLLTLNVAGATATLMLLARFASEPTPEKEGHG